MKQKLAGINTESLVAEIKRREKLTRKLNKRRATLLARVVEVEAQIKASGGEIKDVRAGRAGGKRPKNAMSLPDAMAKVMSKDKTMSVAQIEAAVTKTGYRSTSSTFKTIIFQALAKDKRFKKASRGQYSLR
jgi:hypothetical protein